MHVRRLLVLLLLGLATALLAGGCASGPAYRAQATVLVTGRGERAWENARKAAAALTLSQNLRRIEKDVRRRRLRMLDADDAITVLKEAIVAKRIGKGKVRLRIYGDLRRELRALCNAILNLWESEGIIGKTPESPLPKPVDDEPSPGASAAQDVQRARARAQIEEDQRKLFQEKQQLLSSQVELGRSWQDADGSIVGINKEVAVARKAVSTQEIELQKVQAILRKPAKERYEALGDADVMRLHTEVRDAEAALSTASGLPAEVKTRVGEVLTRKKKALAMAQSRFEQEAQARLTEAKERLTSVEQKLDASTRGQSEVRGKRYALENRLKQIERENEAVTAKLNELRAERKPRLDSSRPAPRPVLSNEAEIYRIREVTKPCRVYRLKDD